VKPVMLPPGCARFAAKPLPIGEGSIHFTRSNDFNDLDRIDVWSDLTG
jgi:hypothetical protein